MYRIEFTEKAQKQLGLLNRNEPKVIKKLKKIR